MPKILDYSEVLKHNSPKSCWVILYNKVYDITSFLPSHPGGTAPILRLAGRDATEEYDPIHPQGTLEANLPASSLVGEIDVATLPAKREADIQIKPASVQSTNLAAINVLDVPIPDGLEACLNIDDIERLSTSKVSPRAWAYYYSASDDLHSKYFNNHVYRSILLRPRIFIDLSRCTLNTRLLQSSLPVRLPIFVSPAAQARLAHPDGEAAIGRACARFGALQLISQNASLTPEQIVEAAPKDAVFGWQLYVQQDRKKSEAMLARVNKLAQVKLVCLTLDAPVAGKREHDERRNVMSNSSASSPPVVVAAAGDSPENRAANASGGVGKALFAGTALDLTWTATLPWLQQHTSLPVVLKGIQTHEDAYIASRHPLIKAIILSNHGGRALDTAPPAVHTLLEIRKYCPDVFDRIEVWVDGGIRRGTDVVKALCLGAKAVGIGRAALWGVGAGGEEGVARVLEIFKAETKTCVRLLGEANVHNLGMHHINARAVEKEIYDGPANLPVLTPKL